MQQLPFQFDYRPAQDAVDFIISDSNTEAVAWIDKYPEWPAPALVIFGTSGSGKSHLASVWQTKANAVLCSSAKEVEAFLDSGKDASVIIDNADTIVSQIEQTVFHLYHRANSNNAKILFCATTPVSAWNIHLPDLLSRLNALPQVRLHEPDDMLLVSLFNKHMTDRGVILKPDAVSYIFPRLPRSAKDIKQLAEELDLYALTNGKPISASLIRAFLNSKEAV